MTLMKSQSNRRWNSRVARASDSACWSSMGQCLQKATGGRSTASPARVARIRSLFSSVSLRSDCRGSHPGVPRGKARDRVVDAISLPPYH